MAGRKVVLRCLSGAVGAGALALVLAAGPSANQQGLAAQGGFAADVTCTWGARDCNPPARKLLSQFRRLRDHGDIWGYRMGPAPDVTMSKHWQGVQRLTADDGRYMVVSRSGKKVSFVVVRMRSRNRSRERLRSNRIGRRSAQVRPPAADRVVKVVRSDADFDHSGGLQSAGQFLAVGLEEGSRSRIVFWDLANPSNPRRLGILPHTTGVKGAGTVSLAKLRSGRYLLIVGGENANNLDFYLSRVGTTLASPNFQHVAKWNERQLVGGDSEFGNYQNLGLVADSDGTLYLIGTHRNRGGGLGKDFADLFRLERTPQSPRIRKIASRHLYCGYPGGTQCNLDAAGGVYVSPSGGLLLYGTEHDNDGPGGTVKAEEFRPAPHRSSCTSILDAWVELYDDTGFDGDRGVMIDFPDRGLRNYLNYDRVERFEDKASAARWCLPGGWRYRLFRHKGNCRGRTVDLVGTGAPASDRKFGDSSGAVRRFNDQVSCSLWIGPPPPPPQPEPQPQPPGKPDLVLTEFDVDKFTVANQGSAAAGPFRVRLTGVGDFAFTGLAAGESESRNYAVGCEQQPSEAIADFYGEVDESDEGNNVRTKAPPIC
jgi:hypothetical protein